MVHNPHQTTRHRHHRNHSFRKPSPSPVRPRRRSRQLPHHRAPSRQIGSRHHLVRHPFTPITTRQRARPQIKPERQRPTRTTPHHRQPVRSLRHRRRLRIRPQRILERVHQSISVIVQSEIRHRQPVRRKPRRQPAQWRRRPSTRGPELLRRSLPARPLPKLIKRRPPIHQLQTVSRPIRLRPRALIAEPQNVRIPRRRQPQRQRLPAVVQRPVIHPSHRQCLPIPALKRHPIPHQQHLRPSRQPEPCRERERYPLRKCHPAQIQLHRPRIHQLKILITIPSLRRIHDLRDPQVIQHLHHIHISRIARPVRRPSRRQREIPQPASPATLHTPLTHIRHLRERPDTVQQQPARTVQ